MRVLICDDHAVFAESLALVLHERGYDIVAVTHTPDEAIAALPTAAVDLCVLDVGFGPASILPRLAELRAAAPDAGIVLLSAGLDSRVVDAGLAAGVRGFAHKSGHIADIVVTMGRVAAGELVFDPAIPRHPAHGGPVALRLADALTARERQVLGRLVRGEDTRALAGTLGVSWATARSHVQNILTKLGVNSRLEAVTLAIRCGLVDPDTGAWLPGGGSGPSQAS
ncbi:helix-turn-helix transcriptional regulator [Longispora fulva]|uniref:DNA-binding NarL/FixJ family response regulator n=1 Tax=Longispora fulva TaxID=619741 RepID=A0A8J7GID4_9ACTN|nr:response regulator transcription factor [Longispora fulva]MBG6137135.1 DNA-binding NarL/FixJ family response regulator [Longispora fulva]GIG61511.1 helix-turn-helix transcriptional regulator [Longispora fulva]